MSDEATVPGADSQSARIQESPNPWPACEAEAQLLHVRFDDDLDRRKLDAFLARLAANPLLELQEAYHVVRDDAERARQASDPNDTTARRSAAMFRGYGQVRNEARQYFARTVDRYDDGFGHLEVRIFRRTKAEDGTGGEEQIGQYRRNYPNLFQGFYPLVWKGRHYALFSRDYTATRIMSLPECEDLGGEERDSSGFCPVDYYVPCDPKTGESCGFAFMSGCVWGDDSSWKLQYLDLSQAHEGKVVREERFGYVELSDRLRLWEAVELEWADSLEQSIEPCIRIVRVQEFDLFAQE